MAEVILRDKTVIGDYKKPYIVAEVNSSHNGDIDTAKEMAGKAGEAGCNCVKFQSWSRESLYSRPYYDANPIAKRIVQKFSLSEDELLDIADFCKNTGISFSSTPYSKKEVDFLAEKCNVPYIKVASMDINNYEYLRYIAQKGLPVILSTGMAEMYEIKKAVKVFEEVGNSRLILLHCISIYPAVPCTVNLNNITGLRNEFPQYPVGFSDHTLGTEIASAATALGACVIEKHFTLDKTKMGMDNNMAIEPDEMAKLVQDCDNVYEAMGTRERIVSRAEYEQREKMRRSVVATRDLAKGTKIRAADIDLKRPGTGLPPEKTKTLIGRVLKCDIAADTMILESDVGEQK